ncbi:MAG: hypothetical protein PHO37_15310 [Kiritimatiellae bacterium]|nr:hypothetical protein [Kiritimatiellia bacterium]
MSESDLKNNGAESENTDSAKVDSKKRVVVELDFAPSWARTSPEEHLKSVQSSRFESDGGGSYNRRPGGRDGRQGGGGERFNRYENANRKTERKPARRREFEPERGGQPAKARSDAPPATVVAPSAGSGAQAGGGDFRERREYSPQERGGYQRRPQYEQRPPLPIEVRVLPEQKALGAVIRRIQASNHAFPLRDIAWLFLDKPASCLVRLAQFKETPAPLFQCKVCGMPALSEEEMELHLMNRHLDEFFDVEEVECGPPGGQFVCVMRCGMTGELLGPPNHHSYNTRVNEMLRTKFPNMTEEAYRRKIESVRETEVIEEWRQSCTKKKIYRRKNVTPLAADKPEPAESVPAPAADEQFTAVEGGEAAPVVVDPVDNEIKAPPMEREVAELVFKREVLTKQYVAVKHMICIASTALQTPNKDLYFAIKDMLNKERRFPTSLFFALRGAFRHRKLHLFRANEARGPDFVMQKKPSELDPAHTVELVKNILAYLRDNPACTKMELVQALSNKQEALIKEILSQLAWLIDKGNIIEFYNEVLSLPIEFPTFRLRENEKKQGKRGEPTAAKEPKSGDKPPKKTRVGAKPASLSARDKTSEPAVKVTVETPAPEPAVEQAEQPAPETQVETPAPEPGAEQAEKP